MESYEQGNHGKAFEGLFLYQSGLKTVCSNDMLYFKDEFAILGIAKLMEDKPTIRAYGAMGGSGIQRLDL